MTRDELVEALVSTRFVRGSDDWKRAVSEMSSKRIKPIVDFVGDWIEG